MESSTLRPFAGRRTLRGIAATAARRSRWSGHWTRVESSARRASGRLEDGRWGRRYRGFGSAPGRCRAARYPDRSIPSTERPTERGSGRPPRPGRGAQVAPRGALQGEGAPRGPRLLKGRRVRERPPCRALRTGHPGCRSGAPRGVAPSLALSESSLAWSLVKISFVDLSTDPHAAMSIDLAIVRSIDLSRPSTRAAATAGGHTTASPTPRSSSTRSAGGRCRRRGRPATL